MEASMAPERYNALIKGQISFTNKEKKEGWHFCREWDGLLIHPTWVEAKYCTCFTRPESVQ